MSCGVVSSIRLALPIQPVTAMRAAVSICRFMRRQPATLLVSGRSGLTTCSMWYESSIESVCQRRQHPGPRRITPGVDQRQLAGTTDHTGDQGLKIGKSACKYSIRWQNDFDADPCEGLTGFTGSEIEVDQIQIRQPHINAAALAVDGQIDGNFGFSAAVIADNDDNALQPDLH